MYRLPLTGALALSLLIPSQTQACRITQPVRAADALIADLVVVGRIENYRLSPDQREARFEVAVDEVLAGELPEDLEVYWDGGNFTVPHTMRAGPFLVALIDQRSTKARYEEPDATILTGARGGRWTILQGLCSEEFILNPDSESAAEVRALLQEHKREHP